MYGHVIRRWFEEITTDGVRPALSSISHDVHRGLYFLYFRTHVDHVATNRTSEITKLYVDPDDVRWVSNAPRSMMPRYGDEAVVGTLDGSWDKFRTPVEETDTYRRLERAYVDGSDNELLSSMQEGYQEVTDESGVTRTIRGVDVPDEIRLAVGGNGELMRWSGGLHRLSAARLLGIERIPAYVVVWHADANRERIVASYGTEPSASQRS